MLNDLIIIPVEIPVWFANERVRNILATSSVISLEQKIGIGDSYSASLSRVNSDMILSCAV